MGLDVTIYGGVKPYKGELSTDHEDIYEEISDIGGFIVSKSLDSFHTRGIDAGLYVSENETWIRAGSYSGYNQWRNQLSCLLGYKGAEAVWNDPDYEKPFVNLIHFSDMSLIHI